MKAFLLSAVVAVASLGLFSPAQANAKDLQSNDDTVAVRWRGGRSHVWYGGASFYAPYFGYSDYYYPSYYYGNTYVPAYSYYYSPGYSTYYAPAYRYYGPGVGVYYRGRWR